MISTEIEGRLPYMTYPESWRAKQPPEFLRPAPKPLRYNGATTITNGNSASGGTRLAAPTPRTTKYSPPAISPVNLTAPHKNSSSSGGGGDEPPSPMTADDIHYTAYRLFSQQQAQQAAVQQQVLAAAAASHPYYTTQPQPPPSAAAAQYNLYLAAANFHHHPIVPRPTYLSQPNLQQQQSLQQQQPPPPPLSPLDTYNTPGTPTSSTSGTGTYLSPGGSSTTSPYSSPPGNNNNNNGTTPSKSRKLSSTATQASFKVPSGKEGSLKHRILTRPEDNNNGLGALDLQSKDSYTSTPPRRRLCATVSSSPPPSTATTTYGNSQGQHHGIKTGAAVNGNSSNGGGPPPSHHGSGGFIAKGTLVQLASGELRKVEDMRTEDFIRSADLNPALRLAESTVVRIDENHVTGGATVTLSYNERRTQVEMESSWEHPYFVMGHGWASCKPDLTLHCFGLKVYPLQVGDILVSLTPRESPPPARTPPVPILTTTSSTATSSHLPLVLPPAPLSLGGTSMVAHPSPMRGSHMTTTSCGPTIITTATSTAMTARTAASVVTSSGGGGLTHHHNYGNPVRLVQQQPGVGVTSPDDSALRKRRWSSDHLSDEDSQQQHNRRIKID